MNQAESATENGGQDQAGEFPEPPVSGWLPAQRRELILNMLLRENVVRVSDLARMMRTTDITIRRDLNILSKAGLVRRVRGGALAVKSLDSQDQSAGSFAASSSYSADAALTGLSGSSNKAEAASTNVVTGRGASSRTGRRNGDGSLSRKKISKAEASGSTSYPTMGEATGQDRAAVVQTGRIGVALPEPSFIWPSVTETIRRMAAEHYGLQVISGETSYETYPEVDILDDLAADPQIRGMIVAPSVDPAIGPATWQWLTKCRLPVTLLERHPPRWLPVFFDSVHTDHPAGVRRGLQQFRQHGHHRVGLALGHTPTAADIELGWRLMMEEGDGLEQTFLLKDKQPYVAEDVEQIVTTILETHTTAVLVHPDYLSIALVQALERRGLRIPRDLSMITIDGYTKRLTVLRSSAQDLAAAALRLQVRRMRNPDQRIEHVRIEPTLIDRGSVADIDEEHGGYY